MGSEYTIGIMAELEGADSTDKILALAASLDQTQAAAGPFDAAIAKVQTQLNAATAAAAAASTGLDEAKASYGQLETAANKAAKQVERAAAKGKDTTELQAAADAAKASLTAQAGAVEEAHNAAQSAATAQEQLAAALDTVESAAASAAKAQAKAADEAMKAAEKEVEAAEKAAEAQTKAAEDAVKAADKEAQAAQKAGEQQNAAATSAGLELMGEKAQKARKAMQVAEALGPWGMLGVVVLAAAAAFVVLGAAIVVGIGKLMGYSVQAVDAARKTQLMLNAAAGSSAGGADLAKMVERVSQKSPQATAEIAKLAENLYKSGKRGAELEKALKEASYEASGLGKNPGPKDLAAAMGDLGVISEKLGHNVALIFSGPAITAAVTAFEADVKEIADMFSQSNTVGKALAAVMSTIFPSLLSSAHGAVPGVKTLITGMALGALNMANAFLQVKIAMKGAFSGLSSIPMGNVDMLKVGMYGIYVVAAVAAVSIGMFALAIGAMAAPFVLAGILVYRIIDAVSELYGTISGLDLGPAAASMIDGLVNGIVSGSSKVIGAIKSLGTNMISAAMNSIDAHSPSKAFYQVGSFGVQGYQNAWEDGKSAVDSSVKSALTPPDSVPGGVGGSSGGHTFNVQIIVDGSGTAAEIGDAVEVRFRKFLQSLATQAGAAVPA